MAEAIVKMVSNRLSSTLVEQANMLWNFSGDLSEMKDTLEAIGATLDDAEKQSIKNKMVQLWLKRLQNAAYDISDMLDEFETDVQQATEMLWIFSFPVIILKKIVLANKIKTIRGKLRTIKEQHDDFSFTSGTSTKNENHLSDPRETSSKVIKDLIFGRAEEKKDIIVLLSACDIKEETTILPIHGFGGLGKTTLARLVFSDSHFLEYYGKAWVYISQKFDLHKIGNSIISQLSKEVNQNLSDLEQINQKLDELLNGRKILIILDDLWEEDVFQLDKLKLMLNVGKKGSKVKVIVTTRSEDIAKKICTEKPYKLDPLNHAMCWEIIKKTSDFESKSEKDQLKDIGLDIAIKCGGVALAAAALGNTLRFKEAMEWLALKDSEIWNETLYEERTVPENRILQSLKLSYKSMPPYLQKCFAYCAIFPKGQNIARDCLLHQWIALDFIKPSAGKNCIKQLLDMSFLEHSMLPSTSSQCQSEWYTIHDLVHDLAKSVVDDELMVFDAAIKSNTSDQKYCRYAMLKNYRQTTKLSQILPSNVRALHVLDNSKLDLRDCAFSFAKSLRILEFRECSSIVLSASIGQLKQLRYFIAPRTQNFPECITELSKLQYLNLHESPQLSELPESIGKLVCLVYLDLSGCSGILKLPESFGHLKNLLHLDLSGCSCIENLSESFGNLNNLQHLDLSGCSNMTELPHSLGNLTNLLHLELSGCWRFKVIPDALCGLTKLQYLNMSNCINLRRLPEAMGSLTGLQYIYMSKCYDLSQLPESFGDLKNLLHLDLSGCYCIENLSESFGNLNNLQHLDLSSCDGITNLPDAFGELKNLKHLNLSSCQSIKQIPVSFCGLTNLQLLNISWCTELERLPETVGSLTELQHFDLCNCWRIKKLPKSFCDLPKLVHLDLSKCFELKGMPNDICGLTTLRHLNLSGTLDHPEHVDCISVLTNLEHLDLSENRNLCQLPESLGNLKRLHTLVLSNCPRLKSLPESIAGIMLKFLVVEECSNELINHICSRFSNYALRTLPLFMVWANDVSSSNLHLLEGVNPPVLNIRFVENVRSLEEAKTIKLADKQNLSKLTLDWTLDAHPHLKDKNLLGELVPPSSLKNFELYGYHCTTFPSWIMGISHHVPNLVSIELKNLPRCSNLPPLGQLPNLEELNLNSLDSITEIGDELRGGKGAFRRLSKFFLWHMKGLEEWTTAYCGEHGEEEFMFPMLVTLITSHCPRLSLKPCPPRFISWGITDSNEVIRSFEVGNYIMHSSSTSTPSQLKVESISCNGSWKLLHYLPTLRELTFSECSELESLPESMQHLACLESLELFWCRSISALPEWIGSKFPSLESLRIIGCERIVSLPSSIGQLSQLRMLHINSNPRLKRWCESQENNMKLAHIQDIRYSNCN
ncbi:hypothetical protein ACP70R_033487 [Stipagrostis hirtigluma subsp. patula]